MIRVSKMAVGLIGYPLVAAFTFAYAASDPSNCSRYECPPKFEGAAMGFAAGVFWPLYWPWEAAEAIRGEEAYARRAAEPEAQQ